MHNSCKTGKRGKNGKTSKRGYAGKTKKVQVRMVR